MSGGPLRVLAELAFLASTLGLLPIPWVLHRLGRSRSAVASVFAVAVGLGGALGTVAVQASAVLGLSTSLEQSAPLVIAFGAIGVWMIISNHLARVDRTLSDGLAWLGVVAGAGLVLAAVVLAVPGFRASDPTVLPTSDPLTAVGLVLSVLAHFASLAWAMWLGRALGHARKRDTRVSPMYGPSP